MVKHRHLLPTIAAAAVLLAATVGGALNGGLPATAEAATNGTLAATAGCGKAPTLTSGTHTIQSSGQNRTYILRIPDELRQQPPVPADLRVPLAERHRQRRRHGRIDGAAWSYYGLQQLSNNSTIFVAPQGIDNGWANTERPGRHLRRRHAPADRGRPVRRHDAASSRMGFSYGGAMSYALACARPTVFRAVAVYSGAQPQRLQRRHPARRVLRHPRHPRQRAATSRNGRSLRDTFVRNNGCTAQNPREPAQGSLTHITTTYSGCRAGYPVQWAAFDGDHTPSPVDGSTSTSGARTWTSGGDLEVLHPVPVHHAAHHAAADHAGRQPRRPRRRPPPRRPRLRPPPRRPPPAPATAPPPTRRSTTGPAVSRVRSPWPTPPAAPSTAGPSA